MEAGKGLDAIIARQVMGWTKATLHDDVTGPEAYWCAGGAAIILVDSWRPSTDIYDAWQVVEKLMRSHRRVEVICEGNNWVCTTWDGGEIIDYCSSDAYADTAPLAICLAALASVKPFEPKE